MNHPVKALAIISLIAAGLSCGDGSTSSARDFAVIFPSSVTVPAGTAGTTQLLGSIRPLNGFSGNISLTITGTPEGVALTFTPPVSAPGTYIMTLSVSSGLAQGTYPIAFLFTSGHLQHTSTLELQVQ